MDALAVLNLTKKERSDDPMVALGLKLAPKQKGPVEDELISMLEEISVTGNLSGVAPDELYNLAQVFPTDPNQTPTPDEARDLADRALERLRRSKDYVYSWASRAAGLRDAVEVQRGLVEEKQAAIDALMRGPMGDVAAARAALENDLRPLVAHLNWLINEQAHAASKVGEDQKETKDHATDALASEIFEVEGQLSEARASQAVLRTHIREAEADSAAWDRTIQVLERRLSELEAKYEYAADREVGYRETKMWDDVDEGMFVLKRERDRVMTEFNRLQQTIEVRKREFARLSSMLDNPGTEDSLAQQIAIRQERQHIDEEIDGLFEQYKDVEQELNKINIELADIMAIRPKEARTKDATYYSKLAQHIQEQKQYIQELETELLVDLRVPDFRDLPESTKNTIVRRTLEVSELLRKGKLDLEDMLEEWDNRPAEYKSAG